MTKKISELTPALTNDSPALVPVVVGSETQSLDMNAIHGKGDPYISVSAATIDPVALLLQDGESIAHTLPVASGHMVRVTYLVSWIALGPQSADYFVVADNNGFATTITQENFLGNDALLGAFDFAATGDATNLTLTITNNSGSALGFRIAPSVIDERADWL